MLLDLVEVAESHTGVNLGIAFVDVLKKFGVEDKVRSPNSCQRASLTCVVRALQILGITGDNASNNNSMIEYISNSLDDFPGRTNQTRCFVHTVNLIAKSILKPFDTQKMKEIKLFNDVAHALSDLAKGHESHDSESEDKDEEDDEDEDDSEVEEDNNELDTSLEPIRAMLLKVSPCFIVHNSKLRIVKCSYANLRLGSRTRRHLSSQHGTEH
jgi:hypothetical protein